MVCLSSSLEIGKKLMGSEDGVIVSDTIGVQISQHAHVFSNLISLSRVANEECGAYLFVTAPKPKQSKPQQFLNEIPFTFIHIIFPLLTSTVCWITFINARLRCTTYVPNGTTVRATSSRRRGWRRGRRSWSSIGSYARTTGILPIFSRP